jgi:hypothetical protein
MHESIRVSPVQRNQYIRPLVVSIAMTELGELFLLILYGVILFPEGSLANKILWTLVFCGIGMGATLGAFVNILVVNRYQGIKAILVTTMLSFIILGIACGLLCLNLDRHFHYFGATSDPYIFATGSVIGSIIGGLAVGIALFTQRGNDFLEKLRI